METRPNPYSTHNDAKRQTDLNTLYGQTTNHTFIHFNQNHCQTDWHAVPKNDNLK